jgi:hypothetical protein
MSLSKYQISFQVSPIILVGGIAGAGMMPIASLLSADNLGTSATHPRNRPDEFFGQFRILPGHSLMDNETATYPLANQTVAANAIITNPLQLSLEMLVPAGPAVTMDVKRSTMTALKSSLDTHTALGGWYNVATPSYVYQGCLLRSLVDASDDEDGSQVQVRWIWNFVQPLLTEAAARAAQNQAMSKISGQTKNSGDPPGYETITTGVGQPSSNISQNLVPGAAGALGSNVAPSGSPSGTTNLGGVSPILPGSGANLA